MTEDHDQAEHETPPKPQDEHVRVAPPDFKTLPHPTDSVNPKKSLNSQYQRDKTNLWPHRKENVMSDVKSAESSGKWRDIAAWQWEREEDRGRRWGSRGGGERRWDKRSWERGRGSGYWQRERRGRRQEYTSKERLQLQQSGVLTRIHSSNTTTEEWNTPLPRDMRKERSVLLHTLVCGIDMSYMYMYIYLAFRVLCTYMHVYMYYSTCTFPLPSFSCCLGNSSAVLILASTLTPMMTSQWRHQG